MVSRFLFSLFFLLSLFASSFAFSSPLGLVLPTDNDAIFSDPSKFYMYVYRNFEGEESRPWSGGGYGLVRNQKRTPEGVISTRFHEGIDILPLRRDAAGEPLDEVRAIAAGTVVHVTPAANLSNYGRYIVIHHDWGEGPFFSLYAHLSAAHVSNGQSVAAGEKIGQMGHTGDGINRERSHVHVELNFILSDRFAFWYDKHFTTKNHHEIYNGMNLTGLDIAQLFLAHHADQKITISQFLSRFEPYYKVIVPAHEGMAFLRRYPWLVQGQDQVPEPKSWEFSFDALGVPLGIRALSQSVSAPVVSYVKPTSGNHADYTVQRLSGTGSTAALSPSGSRYIELITDSF